MKTNIYSQKRVNVVASTFYSYLINVGVDQAGTTTRIEDKLNLLADESVRARLLNMRGKVRVDVETVYDRFQTQLAVHLLLIAASTAFSDQGDSASARESLESLLDSINPNEYAFEILDTAVFCKPSECYTISTYYHQVYDLAYNFTPGKNHYDNGLFQSDEQLDEPEGGVYLAVVLQVLGNQTGIQARSPGIAVSHAAEWSYTELQRKQSLAMFEGG